MNYVSLWEANMKITYELCFLYYNKFDKARWTEQNTFILCEIAVEELRDGNCVKGAWTTRGYQNLKDKYFERAGLKHITKQIKNRFTTLGSKGTDLLDPWRHVIGSLKKCWHV